MSPGPRSRAQRRRDTEHRLTNDKDVWVASSTSPDCLSDIFSSGDALPVRLQALGQLLRAAEGDEVPAGHLVEGNAQTFSHDPALEFHRKEAVVAALQEPRWYVGPLRQGPWLCERRLGLARLSPRPRLGRDLGRNVVEEGVPQILVGSEGPAVALALLLRYRT